MAAWPVVCVQVVAGSSGSVPLQSLRAPRSLQPHHPLLLQQPRLRLQQALVTLVWEPMVQTPAANPGVFIGDWYM